MRNRIPGQVVIQTTNQCNATCPQCGMRRSADIPRYRLSNDAIKKTLDGCAENGVQAVSFTGGEPFLMVDDLIEWVLYAEKVGIPFLRTGTNGFLFCGSHKPGFSDRIGKLAEKLANTSLRNFWISLDSCIPVVHEKMRGLPGVVIGIEKALPIFHAAGIYPSANLGINRLLGGVDTSGLSPDQFKDRNGYLTAFYDHFAGSLERFYCLVKDLGFTIANTCYPMSISEQEMESGLKAVYAATAEEDVVRFANDEKAMLFKVLLDIIPEHRHDLRIFSPLSSIYMLYQSYQNRTQPLAFGCRGGIDFFFIDAADGNTYPCGYRGNENMGKFWNLNLKDCKPSTDCLRCDWECFRDPSELFAPFLQIFNQPFKLLRKMSSDTTLRRLWVDDLAYYRDCDFFDGRKSLDLKRLSSHKNLA